MLQSIRTHPHMQTQTLLLIFYLNEVIIKMIFICLELEVYAK